MNRLATSLAFIPLVAACAHQGAPSDTPSGRATYSGDSAFEARGAKSTAAPAAPPSGARQESAAAPTAMSSADADASAVARESEARPGLGTAWGETMSSRVSSAPFERAEPQRPFSVASLYYNDANGIRAMTRGAWLGAPNGDGVNVAGGALTVRLLDAAGRPLPTYDLGARRYVVGNDGERYILAIQNHTGNRVEAVATVDGLDVIDGRSGSFEKRGYLIQPWGSVEIDGFRQSLDEVAAFRFGAVGESYAAKKGDDRNVGVVGVAFFAEEGAPYPFTSYELERRRDANPFPGRFASPPN
jgi:hypothetical protein